MQIRQQLAQREANELLRQLRDPETPLPADWTDRLRSIQESIKQQVEIVKGDLERLAAAVPEREQNIRELYGGRGSDLAGGVDAETAITELRSRFKTVVENYRLLLEGSVPAFAERSAPSGSRCARRSNRCRSSSIIRQKCSEMHSIFPISSITTRLAS